MNKKKTIGITIIVIGIILFLFAGYKLLNLNRTTSKDSNLNNIENNSLTEVKEDKNIESNLELKELDDLEYYLYTPKNPKDNMPLIMYLHGATFKNLEASELLKADGFPKYLNDKVYGDLQSYVVIPKIDESVKNWVDISDSIEKLIKSLNENYKIDLSKVSLTGHSIGGTGTYQLQIKLPNTFACIAPMSGFIRNSDENINALSKTKIWAFVGTNDTVISPNSTKQAIKLLKDKGIDAKITEYQDADHFTVPVLGYKDKDFINWLVNCGN